MPSGWPRRDVSEGARPCRRRSRGLSLAWRRHSTDAGVEASPGASDYTGVRRALAPGIAAALAAWLCLPAASLAVGAPQRHGPRVLFDVRAGRAPARPAGSARARLQLDRALGPGGVLDVDPLNGGTRTLARLGDFLTGPAAG